MPDPRLILASASPRRQSLLREAGYDFLVHPADLDEDALTREGGLPADLALKLALAKAQVVADQFPQDLVLAADTLVAFGDQILGKPTDEVHARQMLELLSDTTHLVITGLCAIHKDRPFTRSQRVMSAVRMRELTPREIELYVQSGQWQGKAGGYGIQDRDPFVTRMTGSHSNIVGLPLKATIDLLTEAGLSPARPPTIRLD